MSELSMVTPTNSTRFRTDTAWYASSRQSVGDSEAHHTLPVVRTVVGAPAERLVDTLHVLSAFLDPAIDVAIHDVRSGRRWQGSLLPLPDVREVVGRLRYTLVAYGGVEVMLYTDQDQLTITPELLLVIDARTDRWLYRLDAEGFAQRDVPPPPTWQPQVVVRKREAMLEEALWVAAERLGLAEARA